jgi:SAM-dependent methyltransferase
MAIGAPRTSFSAARLARIAEMEPWHFWFVGRRALVQGLLTRHGLRDGGSLLDLGCGTGGNVGALGSGGVGLDLRDEGLRKLRARDQTARVVRGDGMRLPFGDAAFMGVLALDVAEHVDDARLLGEIDRVLCPGGALILTVPAQPQLWSDRDVHAGHLRRYTRASLEAALESAGFQVQDLGWYQCLLYPLVAASRARSRRRPEAIDDEERPGPVIKRFLTWVTLAEVWLGLGRRMTRGSTLFAVARKAA